MQSLLAIARLTWRSAFRYRMFWVLTAALLGAVVGLPALIKGDGTARGFVQVLLTYTLSLASFLLGMSTLWLSCGALAGDIEECQIQMVSVKPVGRWKIWLGKWLGILMINAALLAIVGVSILLTLEWRSRELTPQQQTILRDEVLVSRAAFKPLRPPLDQIAQERFAKLMEKQPLTGEDARQAYMREAQAVYAEEQLVPPGGSKSWMFALGLQSTFLGDQPLYIRTRFFSATTNQGSLYRGQWQFATPDSTVRNDTPELRLASESFQEIRVPSTLVDSLGRLIVIYRNLENSTLLFSLDDSIEILYRDGGFGINLARGLTIVLAWLSLLSAVGLAAASIASFPVAAFCSLSLLIVVGSSGSMADAVSNETVLFGDMNSFGTVRPAVDAVMLPAFKAILALVNVLDVASPVDSLSTGRSITWFLVGAAWFQVVLLTGGTVAAIGIWLLSRRELASTQGTQ